MAVKTPQIIGTRNNVVLKSLGAHPRESRSNSFKIEESLSISHIVLTRSVAKLVT
jgi:hypothetical protein